MVAGTGFVGPGRGARGVAGERGDRGAVSPFQRLEREAGGIPAGIAVPASGRELRFHLSGAHHDEIAALDLHAAGRGGAVEILPGDGVTVLEHVLAQRIGDVEKYPAAEHPLPGLPYSALLRAGRNS